MSVIMNENSPVPILKKIYNNSKTRDQKQACLRYLLQYQQYNANYTEEENDQQLGYPMPLVVKDEKSKNLSGYFRTEFRQIFQLVNPYLKKKLEDFKLDNTTKLNDKLVKLTSSLAINILKRMCKKFSFVEIEKFKNSANGNQTEILIVNIKTADLQTNAYNILNKRLNDNIKISKKVKGFIFLLKEDNIDCVIMWAISWTNPKKNNNLQFLGIKDLLENENIFSLLNECGGVPDRLSVNQFLTQTLYMDSASFEDNVKDLNLDEKYLSEKIEIKENWNLLIETIREYNVSDEGSSIYREAFLKWQDKFFNEHEEIRELAIPLMHSQVILWISEKSTVVQWAKSYQNLCEIVMFCLDYFPEISNEIKFEQIALKLLDRGNIYENKTFCLDSYAMTSIFSVFNQILGANPDNLSIACISQNYFETLDIIDKMKSYGILKVEKCNSLNDIKEMPNILIADIHPNNAAKDVLFENDIANWIENKLKNNDKTLILILDITLNSLSDDDLKFLLDKLKNFVEDERLEIFAIQSLAKLVQLGSDNFSGGICFYLGNSNRTSQNAGSSSSIPHKSAFFGLIFQNFQETTGKYFKQIRKNTNWMYDKLKERFEKIKRGITKKKEDHVTEILRNFLATNITTNPDERTVYVALHFDAFFNKLKINDDKEKESYANNFRKLILKSARLRGLPITGRQSFGFALSNMSVAVNAIRFSIGVESQSFLTLYANLVADFNFALTEFVTNGPNKFCFKEFEKHFIVVNEILFGEKDYYASIKVKQLMSWRGHNYIDDKQDEEICFKKSKFILKITKEHEVIEHDIKTFNFRNYSIDLYEHLFSLIFQFESKTNEIVISKIDNEYDLENLEDFCRYSELQSFEQKETIVVNNETISNLEFYPYFALKCSKGKVYKSDKVFIKGEEVKLDTKPVKLNKLDEKDQSIIFEKCYHYHLEIEDYEEGRESVLLKFKEMKVHLNYEKCIVDFLLFGGLDKLAEFLNDLDLNGFPLVENGKNIREFEPFTYLNNKLTNVVVFLFYIDSDINSESILKINNKKFQASILKAMFIYWYMLALEDKKKQFKEFLIRNISSVFKSKEFVTLVCDNSFKDEFKENISKISNIQKDTTGLLLNSYFYAVIPIVKHFFKNSINLFETNHSVSLKKCSVYSKDLKKHIEELESGILECKNATIDDYLNLYIKYPLAEGMKRNILEMLKTKPDEILMEWIINPKFYYPPLNEWEIEFINPFTDYCYDIDEREKIKDFFMNSGCENILLKMPFRKDMTFALKWAKILQEPKLNEYISRYYNEANENNLEAEDGNLKDFEDFLKNQKSNKLN